MAELGTAKNGGASPSPLTSRQRRFSVFCSIARLSMRCCTSRNCAANCAVVREALASSTCCCWPLCAAEPKPRVPNVVVVQFVW